MSLVRQLQGSADKNIAIERELTRLRNALVVRIVDLVNDREWSIEELADSSGWSVEEIRRIVNGGEINLRQIVELEYIFGEPIIEVARQ